MYLSYVFKLTCSNVDIGPFILSQESVPFGMISGLLKLKFLSLLRTPFPNPIERNSSFARLRRAGSLVE